MPYAVNVNPWGDFSPVSSFCVFVPWVLNQANVVQFPATRDYLAIQLAGRAPELDDEDPQRKILTQPPVPFGGGANITVQNDDNDPANCFTLQGGNHLQWTPGLFGNQHETLHLISTQSGGLNLQGWKCELPKSWENQENEDTTFHQKYALHIGAAQRVCYSVRGFGVGAGIKQLAFIMPLLDQSIFDTLLQSFQNNQAFPAITVDIHQNADQQVVPETQASGYYLIAQGAFKQLNWPQLQRIPALLANVQNGTQELFATLCEWVGNGEKFPRNLENSDATNNNSVYENQDAPVEVLFLNTDAGNTRLVF